MAETVTIQSLFAAYRGIHDFSQNSLLYLGHDVVVYCDNEIVYGIPSMVILACVQGHPTTEVILDHYPLEDRSA